ncbi:hypothetical protein U1Q18_012826, partial [Sarracenia purpurea var. burkii]
KSKRMPEPKSPATVVSNRSGVLTTVAISAISSYTNHAQSYQWRRRISRCTLNTLFLSSHKLTASSTPVEPAEETAIDSVTIVPPAISVSTQPVFPPWTRSNTPFFTIATTTP